MKKIYKSGNYVIVEDGTGNVYQYASGATAYGRKEVSGVDSFILSESGVGTVIEGQYRIPVADVVAGDWFDEAGAVAYTESTFTDFIRTSTGFKSTSGGSGVNIGAGTGLIFGGIDTSDGSLEFKSLIGGTNVTVTDNANDITIDASGGGGGSNIATSDLTISASGVRKLIFGGASGGDRFVLRNSADTKDLFWQGGDGSFALGYDAINLGSNPTYNVVIGKDASNNYQSNVVAIGHQAFSTAIGGTAIGKDAQVLSNYGTSVGNLAFSGLNSVAIGKSANASLGQYNMAIGELSSCTAFFGIAIGRSVTAGDRATAINGSATLVQGVAMGYGSSAGSYALSLGGYASTGNHGTAVGYDTSANGLNLAVGRGMETSGNYSVSIGACAYGQTRANSVLETFNWFTNDADPIVRFGKTADQWNMGTGSFGYGTMTPDASAVIDLTSTTKGFLPPRMTTTERDAISTPAEGLVVYNTTTQVLNFYNGTVWGAV